MSESELVAAAGRLKSVKRRGWLDAGIATDEAESVADHSFRVAFMAAFLSVDGSLDVLKVVKMALLHDLAEHSVGDLTPRSGVSIKLKARMEERVIRGFGNDELTGLWTEYEQGRTPEARAARELDIAERVIQAREYTAVHPGLSLDHFWKGVGRKVRNPLLRALMFPP